MDKFHQINTVIADDSCRKLVSMLHLLRMILSIGCKVFISASPMMQ